MMLPMYGSILPLSTLPLLFLTMHLQRPHSPVLLFLLLAAFCSAAHGAVVTLGADKDTTIIQSNQSNSLGGGPAFFAGTNNNNSPRRALLSFDLSSIPAGATISDVRLTLTLAQVSGMNPPGSATIGLFDLTKTWGEGTAGSTAAGIAGTGNGFAASAGDATWSAAQFPSIAWAMAGGDHTAAASGSLLLTGTTPGTAFTWLSTAEMVADAQHWLDAPTTNFGWELINANETAANSIYGFYSSEWDSFAGGNASQEPVLQVTYTVPEPASGLLTATAMFSLLSARPKRCRVKP